MDKLLEGYGILCTAVHSRERDELARQVVQWGGEFLSTFSVKDPPHLIITRSVRSPKYRALLRAHPHILAVTPEWLSSCAQAGAAAAAARLRIVCCCWPLRAAAARAMQNEDSHSRNNLPALSSSSSSSSSQRGMQGPRRQPPPTHPPIPPSCAACRRGACCPTTPSGWEPSTA